MTINEYKENATIEYKLTVEVNGEKTIQISAFSEQSLMERLGRVDWAIKNQLEKQFEDLPETGVNENE